MTQERIVYALGFFDGVHRGHQALLAECRALAQAQDATPAALTFSNHPDALTAGQAPRLLTTVEDRRELLHAYGMERVLALPFDRTTMTTPWQDFFHRMVTEFHAVGLVCGHDFRFGYRGEGTPQLLGAACAQAGIPCTVVPEQRLEGVTVSSAYIRTLLECGEAERAARFLGHPHFLTGPVVSGHHLGRRLGFPTANLGFPEGVLVPKCGVYACRARVAGAQFCAVANVGVRPTVGGSHVNAEAWLLDFDGDLYGEEMTLQFYSFLRPERKFESLEAMKEEILKNARQTRAFFQGIAEKN